MSGIRFQPVTMLRFLKSVFLFLAALVILFEEWLWEPLRRLMQSFGRLPLVRRLSAVLAALSPRMAVLVYLGPMILLVPFKIAGLWLIGQGHTFSGLLTFLSAKVLGTALFSWLFSLTKPALLRIGWFSRAYDQVCRISATAHDWIRRQPLYAWLRRKLRSAIDRLRSALGRRPMATYRSMPIHECHDPLVEIPRSAFAFTDPHPYARLGAPYGGASPWMLRQPVLAALLAAQAELERRKPGWRLKLFDAYRPIPVQAFMVWREFQSQAGHAGRSLDEFHDLAALEAGDPTLYALLAPRVFEFWGMPSLDPRTPPPHSTGAAIDLTLEDASGQEVDMGCPIDETTERAYPDHYARAHEPELQACHRNRCLLEAVMASAGFARHGNEWWHFSLGDQLWAWTRRQPAARYGAVRRAGYDQGSPAMAVNACSDPPDPKRC